MCTYQGILQRYCSLLDLPEHTLPVSLLEGGTPLIRAARLPLIPGALAAIQAAKKAGASAVALSGAGPSLIAFSGQPANPGIGLAMQKAFEQAGREARIFPLNISQSGGSVLESQAKEENASFLTAENHFVR